MTSRSPAAILAVLVLAAVAITLIPQTRVLGLQLLDLQYRALRVLAPQPASERVVVVGIDEATLAAFPEPQALWHARFGSFLQAMAVARPAAVGLDVVLPERSFDAVMPGADKTLLTGILALRRVAPLVLGVTIGPSGRPRGIHPPFVAVAGPDSTGFVLWKTDDDGVIRRFDQHLGERGEQLVTLVGALAARMGTRVVEGLIDFSRGEAFRHVPMHEVLAWHDAGDVRRLRSVFEGRAVLLGTVQPFLDRLPVPVRMFQDEQDVAQTPGVVVHAQTLRNLLDGTIIRPIAQVPVILLTVIGVLAWFAGGRLIRAAIVVGVATATLLLISTVLLRAGWHLPVVGAIVVTAGAATARLGGETAARLRERRRLRGAFAGYVSPQIMQSILSGDAGSGLGGRRFRICVLFADVRSFTTRSEGMQPEALIALLNRYFQEVTVAIHQHQGTVDKFIGDGIMAFFGAPNALPNPSAAAVAAAYAMLQRLEALNRALEREGTPRIEIGIGLHVGEAVVGHVGSEERHDYTAIGDVVNVASRLEGVTKEVGYRIVASRRVVADLPDNAGFVDLGAQPIKGHAAVEVCGWGPISTLGRQASGQQETVK